MSAHLHEVSGNGQLEVDGATSSVGYKLVASQEEGGEVRVAVSVMAPRDWLLKQGFSQQATLIRSKGARIGVAFEGKLDVTDSISVSLRAQDDVFPDLDKAREAYPELGAMKH